MQTQQQKEPDYGWWVKKDTWTLKEGALLIHGFEPLDYRSFRPYDRTVPSGLEAVQKTYLLLHSFPWRTHCPGQHYTLGHIHPAVFIAVASDKELPIPTPLISLIETRLERESEPPTYPSIKKQIRMIARSITPTTDEERPLAERERRSLLKIIALLVQWQFGTQASPKHRHGQSLNAYQIGQWLLQRAEALQMSTDGLKSANRKISDALTLLEETSNYGIAK